MSKYDDLVARLRDWDRTIGTFKSGDDAARRDLREAADAIELLIRERDEARARAERLEKALREAADFIETTAVWLGSEDTKWRDRVIGLSDRALAESTPTPETETTTERER